MRSANEKRNFSRALKFLGRRRGVGLGLKTRRFAGGNSSPSLQPGWQRLRGRSICCHSRGRNLFGDLALCSHRRGMFHYFRQWRLQLSKRFSRLDRDQGLCQTGSARDDGRLPGIENILLWPFVRRFDADEPRYPWSDRSFSWPVYANISGKPKFRSHSPKDFEPRPSTRC
jgi:hypothetical protein